MDETSWLQYTMKRNMILNSDSLGWYRTTTSGFLPPHKGQDVLIDRAYTTILDEFGNDVARLKNADIKESLTVP